jgi:alpha-D-xyloside xylohydrolase
MKTRLLLLLVLSTNCLAASATDSTKFEIVSVRKDRDGISLKMNSGMLKLQVFSETVIRVLYTSENSLPQTKSFSVIAQPTHTPWRILETSDLVRLRTGALEVRVDRLTGVVKFYDRNGNAILVEGQRSLTPAQLGNLKTLRSRQEFILPPDEAIFGLGQHQLGLMNYRNSVVRLLQENTKVGIPVLVSNKGYGLLWDNPAVTDVNVGAGEKQPIPSAQLYDENGRAGGLTGRYYKDEKFGELAVTQTDPQVDFDWSATFPAGLSHDHYSVRWTGFVEAKQTGDYTFFTASDDGVRLWIDDELLTDDWNSHADEIYALVDSHTARVYFPSNSRHKIRLEYYQSKRDAKINLAWSLPSLTPRVSWSSEAADSVDYYFMYGPELDQVIASYRNLTGAAPMFGRWAWGFWQCKERYKSQQELMDVVNEYRRRNIPIDGIIQDWQYWNPAPWGSHEFDSVRYPDPKKMVEQLHAANTHFLVYVSPMFDPEAVTANELRKAGGLYSRIFPTMGNKEWYDPFLPVARQIYWQQISKELFSYNIDGWWLDSSEPTLSHKWGEFRDVITAEGLGAKVFNAYPLMHTTAVYQGQRTLNKDKRVLILTRSAFAGQQRNAAITWSGDIRGNWDTFSKQVPAGINFSLSGIPYWNTDTGGFFGGDPKEAGYRELFTRWFQFSAFCPMFRVHGSGKPKEIWRFDDPTQKILISYDELRYHLLPYIYSVSSKVTHEGYTLMRGLVMDFRKDRQVYDISDQYMFGPSIMVSPVTKPRAAVRSVYLPEGTSWIDFWTGKTYKGGQTIQVASPIAVMPLFIRAGSIIPYGPSIQYAMEKSEPIELHIYGGANGSFTLYEDEGDNYNYEKRIYATIPIFYNESKHILTIGKRQGSFPGMLKERTFHVVWIRPGHGTGIPMTERPDIMIRYNGSPVTVSRQIAQELVDLSKEPPATLER